MLVGWRAQCYENRRPLHCCYRWSSTTCTCCRRRREDGSISSSRRRNKKQEEAAEVTWLVSVAKEKEATRLTVEEEQQIQEELVAVAVAEVSWLVRVAKEKWSSWFNSCKYQIKNMARDRERWRPFSSRQVWSSWFNSCKYICQHYQIRVNYDNKIVHDESIGESIYSCSSKGERGTSSKKTTNTRVSNL